MIRSNVFLKVQIECHEPEKPETIAEQLCRGLMKLYGVRSAEVSSVTLVEE
jgi:hypothetical protein